MHLGNIGLGVSTAATQIEGGHAATAWHAWAREPGHIVDGTSPAIADDHWNRYAADTELLAEMGVRHYRMSLEWARLEPAPGEFDETAFGHYRDELALLRAKGITPLVTLHHFSNPVWFEERGGFLKRGSVATFERYVRACVERLGDLVDEWITINEPNVYASGAYMFGMFPPGHRSLAQVIRAYRHLACAHIKAYRAIHELSPTAKVGVANHLRVFAPLDPRNPRHRFFTAVTRFLFQEAITEAFCTGRTKFKAVCPGEKPGRYYDFLGLNYYTRTAVSRMADGVFPGVPTQDLGWEIYPEGIVACARWLVDRYPGVPLYVTENGTCDLDDSFRSRYIYDHLQALVSSGLPVERYYHWCFIDNWEWDKGEYGRFGLVHNDFASQHRTVKTSGKFYAAMIQAGGVTDDIYATYVAGQEYPRHEQPSAVGASWG